MLGQEFATNLSIYHNMWMSQSVKPIVTHCGSYLTPGSKIALFSWQLLWHCHWGLNLCHPMTLIQSRALYLFINNIFKQKITVTECFEASENIVVYKLRGQISMVCCLLHEKFFSNKLDVNLRMKWMLLFLHDIVKEPKMPFTMCSAKQRWR